MKTTIDLPEELVKEMKLKAVLEGRKLRDVAAEVLRRGLEVSSEHTELAQRQRIQLPIVKSSSSGQTFCLSNADIHRIEREMDETSM